MAIQTLTREQLRARLANTSRIKSNGQLPGYHPDERKPLDTTPIVKPEEIVGKALNVLEKSGPLQPHNSYILRVQLPSGAVVKFWVPKGIERQMDSTEPDAITDDLLMGENALTWMLVPGLSAPNKRGERLPTHYLDYFDPERAKAAQSRERVSLGKNQPKPVAELEMEEEEEEEEEFDSIEEEEEEEEEEEAPRRATVARKVPAKTSPVKPAPKPVKPAPKPAKPAKHVEPGKIVNFGNGDFTRGRGRPPAAVSAYTASGHDAYYSLKTGRYFQDDRKTQIK